MSRPIRSQKSVNRSAKFKGAKFVYARATESHTYRDPYFSQQYRALVERLHGQQPGERGRAARRAVDVDLLAVRGTRYAVRSTTTAAACRGDQDYFNGSMAQLRKFARGS